jgi:dCTP deaminase
MSLLRDEELIASIIVQSPAIPLVQDLELPADPFSKDSPIQGASVDLHIGEIYLPGKKAGTAGAAGVPKSDHSLQTGETAVVTTKETLHLPPDVGAFGFPPSRVSFRGLLMTNPGHVDPGYDGAMRFTVINMAREAYTLNRGDRIVTLLFFRMAKASRTSWRQRNPNANDQPSPITQTAINLLAHDFVNVESRAKKIARDHGIKVGLIVTSALAVLTVLTQSQLLYRKDINEIRQRQDMVEYDLKNRVDIERKLQELDTRLKDLERTQPTRNPKKAEAKSSGSDQ